jgi:hypothetical protein
MKTHDWLVGLLAELEAYCDLNNLPKLKSLLTSAIEISIEETCSSDHGLNVISLESYLVKRSDLASTKIVENFADKLNEFI